MKLLPVLVVAVLALTACGVSILCGQHARRHGINDFKTDFTETEFRPQSRSQTEFGNEGGGEFVVRATVTALICAQVQSRF